MGQVDLPAIGKLTINDLSPILPPGIPAVSRIYCEKLVDEFNKYQDQEEFERMEVIAKRARELAPDEPIVQQMWQTAKFLRRLVAAPAFLRHRLVGDPVQISPQRAC